MKTSCKLFRTESGDSAVLFYRPQTGACTMTDLGLPNLGLLDAADLLRSLGFEAELAIGTDQESWGRALLHGGRRSLTPELAQLKLGLVTR